MNKKLLFLIGIFLIFSGGMTLAIELPAIPGAPTINDQSNINQVAMYFYVFFVIVAVAVAVVKIALSGFNLLMSEASPAKFSKTRNEILGILVGIVVLLSPVIIINLVNPEINEPVDLTFPCSELDYCAIRTTTEVKDGVTEKKETKEMTVQSEVNFLEGVELTIKKYLGLQNIIGYTDINYQGSPSLLYANNTSEIKQIDNEIKIFGPKSFQVITKRPGLFLYELPQYQIATLPPFYTKSSINNLKNIGYENKIGSINIVNPQENENIDYMGVLFEGDSSRMTCKVFYENIEDVPAFFQTTINSLKVFKRDKEYFKGMKIRLILYNNESCSERGENTEEVAASQLQKCELTFLEADKDVPEIASAHGSPICDSKGNCSLPVKAMETIINPLVISSACPNLKGEIYSFRIDSPSAIIFMDSGNRCDMWDNIRIGRGQGVCNLVNSSGFNPLTGFNPSKITIVPYNE